MWVDVLASLWRRNECCHDLWCFVLWRCFDLLDHRAVGDKVWLGVGSSVVVRWLLVFVVLLMWISLLRRPRTWPRSLLLAASLIVLLCWCWCGHVVVVGDAVQRRLICSFHWRGVVPKIVVVSRVPVGSDGFEHRWRLRLCVEWVCSLS